MKLSFYMFAGCERKLKEVEGKNERGYIVYKSLLKTELEKAS